MLKLIDFKYPEQVTKRVYNKPGYMYVVMLKYRLRKINESLFCLNDVELKTTSSIFANCSRSTKFLLNLKDELLLTLSFVDVEVKNINTAHRVKSLCSLIDRTLKAVKKFTKKINFIFERERKKFINKEVKWIIKGIAQNKELEKINLVHKVSRNSDLMDTLEFRDYGLLDNLDVKKLRSCFEKRSRFWDIPEKRKVYVVNRMLEDFINFLMDCLTTNNSSFRERLEDILEGKRFYYWVGKEPIPYKQVTKKYYYLFCRPTRLRHENGSSILEKEGIIKVLSHIYNKDNKGECRKILFSTKWLRSFLKKDCRLSFNTTLISSELNCSLTLKDLLQYSPDLKTPRHHLSYTSSNYRVNDKTRKISIDVCNKLSPISIDLSFLEKGYIGTFYQITRIIQFVKHLCSRGTQKSLNNVYLYYAEYIIADIGSRLFEKGLGFQNLPNKLKWLLSTGINYDIVNCQLNILKNECQNKLAFDVDTSKFNLLNKDIIARRFNIPINVAKIICYGFIFNGGIIASNRISGIYDALRSQKINDADCLYKIQQIKKYLQPLSYYVSSLIDYYISTAKYSYRGYYYINNVCFQPIKWPDSKNTALLANAKSYVKKRRQILAHMIQGIESKSIRDLVLNNPNKCCSLEHDGVVALEAIKWEHDFLKIEQKH